VGILFPHIKDGVFLTLGAYAVD